MQVDGNVRDEASGQKTGINVLHLAHPPTNTQETARLESIRNKMLAARAKRIPPYRDDKVLTDWNGLMIAALSIAGRALNDSTYTAAAERAADFVLTKLRKDDGRLLHRWRAGKSGLAAHLDDYAFFVWGLIELYESGFEPGYLKNAMELNEIMLHQFSAPGGGFYFTAEDAEILLVRPMDAFDNAIPSGNAVAMLNLLRLSALSGDARLAARAAGIPKGFAKDLNRAPSAFIWLLAAQQQAEADGAEVVLAGKPDSPEIQTMIDALNSSYHPEHVVLLAAPELAAIAPYTSGYSAEDGQATAYVCRGGQCNLPVTSAKEMLKQIELLRDEQP
jgi:hypothetical protein